MGVRAIVVVDVKLVLAFDLKNALSGPRAEESYVIRAGVEHKLHAVVGALHRGKGEVRDEAAGDARLNDLLQQRVFGFLFEAVEVLETADAGCELVGRMKVHIRVFEKAVGHVGVIIVCRVIASAQAELALRSGHDRGGGQAEDCGLLAIDVPVKMLAGLSDADAQERIPEGVITVPGVAFEPVPVFCALAPVDVDLKRAHLVRGRRSGRDERSWGGDRFHGDGLAAGSRGCSGALLRKIGAAAKVSARLMMLRPRDGNLVVESLNSRGRCGLVSVLLADSVNAK